MSENRQFGCTQADFDSTRKSKRGIQLIATSPPRRTLQTTLHAFGRSGITTLPNEDLRQTQQTPSIKGALVAEFGSPYYHCHHACAGADSDVELKELPNDEFTNTGEKIPPCCKGVANLRDVLNSQQCSEV
jgi:hypothetical protein